MRTWQTFLALVLTIALVSAACGDDNDDDAEGTGESAATAEPTTTVDNSTKEENAAVAEAFVDAFYSFDSDELFAIVTRPQAQDFAGFYQGWAEAANYSILERNPCEAVLSNTVWCAITVEDDFTAALGIDFDVTDTFTLTFGEDGEIKAVDLSSDDPDESRAAFESVFDSHPELFDAECQGFFLGGPTPGDCALAFIAAFEEYAESATIQG
jgi:hypothetical protein